MNQTTEWITNPDNTYSFYVLDKQTATIKLIDKLYYTYTEAGEFVVSTLEEAKHMAELTAYVIPNKHYARH